MEQIGKALAGDCLAGRKTGVMPAKYITPFSKWIKGIVSKTIKNGNIIIKKEY